MNSLILVIWMLFCFLAECVSGYTLQMNCTAEGLAGSACMNYMRDYLNNYILVEKKYNRETLPVPKPYGYIALPSAGDVYDTVNVRFLLTLKNLVAMDSAAGSMTVAAFIDIYWTDQLLSWDPQWTDGYDFFNIDYSLIWNPDIQLYNAIGKYIDQVGEPALFLSSNGNALWDATALLTFSCDYDTVKFPFDTQTCQAKFGSWSYSNYELNITEAALSVTDTFTNIAWSVEDVSGNTETTTQFGDYPYTFAIYTFKLGRYYNHYVSNAIVPSLLVTYLSLISLWIDDISVRLSIGITALLALIAVQWTVSSEIPVSSHEPWLSKLSNVCICYTVFVCMEGYLVGYMRDCQKIVKDKDKNNGHGQGAGRSENTQQSLPMWASGLIYVSMRLNSAVEITLRWLRIRVREVVQTARDTIVQSNAADNSTGPAQSNSHGRESMQNAVELTSNPMSQDPDADVEGNAAVTAMEPAAVSEEHMCRPSESELAAHLYTWDRAAMALDHLSRMALPFSFTLIVLVFFGEVST